MADATATPTETPATRIAAAIRGVPAHALPEVRAADVLELVKLVPVEKQSDVVQALAKGSTEAVAGLLPHRAAVVTCHPQAGDLARLLEASGVHAL